MDTTTEQALSITTERIGRRTYIRGATYHVKDKLRAAGAHWDADQKAWWIGSDEEARRLAAAYGTPVQPKAAAPSAPARVAEELVPVAGNTYPVREQIRALGGRWDGATKVWMVPASKAVAARALVAAAPVETRAKYEVVKGMVVPTNRRGSNNWRPCGYPGCSPNYCDECDGEGYRPAGGRRWGR